MIAVTNIGGLVLTSVFLFLSSEQERAASELNHRIIGLALIAVAVLVGLGEWSPQLKCFRYAWPLLFAAMGLFLALWSDAEIWPRGPLSWSWLIDHDSEARQHKFYAIMLFAIAGIEFLRNRSKPQPRSWKIWLFPAIAVIGAALLGFHAHSGTSGLVHAQEHTELLPQSDSALMTEHQHHASHVESQPQTANPRGGHAMHAEDLKIQKQHLQMMVVGVAIAVLKLIADGEFIRSRVVVYLWPALTGVLGFLLVFYKE